MGNDMQVKQVVVLLVCLSAVALFVHSITGYAETASRIGNAESFIERTRDAVAAFKNGNLDIVELELLPSTASPGNVIVWGTVKSQATYDALCLFLLKQRPPYGLELHALDLVGPSASEVSEITK